MATQTEPVPNRGPFESRRDRSSSGGMLEAFVSACGVALAIIGLAGAATRFLDTIAVIVLGAAFLFERWAVSARQGSMLPEPGDRRLSMDAFGGWAGIVLGILALLRLAPTVLAPIAVIAFGVALAFGSAKSAIRSIPGVAAIALGILALIQINPRTLMLVGLIAVGFALMVSGAMIGARTHRSSPLPA